MEQADNEEVTRYFDYTAQLGGSVTVSSAVMTVYDETELDTDVTSTVIPGSVTATSPRASALVKDLERGHKYRLECLATTSDSQKLLTYIIIQCPA